MQTALTLRLPPPKGAGDLGAAGVIPPKRASALPPEGAGDLGAARRSPCRAQEDM
jgi:hypothetical protein